MGPRAISFWDLLPAPHVLNQRLLMAKPEWFCLHNNPKRSWYPFHYFEWLNLTVTSLNHMGGFFFFFFFFLNNHMALFVNIQYILSHFTILFIYFFKKKHIKLFTFYITSFIVQIKKSLQNKIFYFSILFFIFFISIIFFLFFYFFFNI